MRNKILSSLEEASTKIKELKKKKKKIVLCHGVFDVIHLGHINHFKSAKSQGNILIVTVTADEYVNKGPNRPIFTLQMRMELLSNLNFIDFVCPNYTKTAVDALTKIKPDIYCKGKDYKDNSLDVSGQIKEEKKTLNYVGGKIYYTEDATLSSSKIINQSGFKLNKEQKKYLSLTNKKIPKNIDINKTINNYKNFKILIIGESIIDEYFNCETLGKSGKEPVLVLRDLNSKKYLGGALAIANNLANFSNNITLLSYLGEKKDFFSLITKSLNKKIKNKFIFKKGAKTILKRRYVDNITNQKVFGLYSIDDQSFEKKDEDKFKKLLKAEIPKHDIVLVSDYGHGLISKSSAKIIVKKSKFLAINAQLNAANVGHHTIARYKNADLVIINENEMRHELRNKVDTKEHLIRELSKKLNSKLTVATSGDQGSLIYDKIKKKIIKCPAFASKVKDKVGTGDAMLVALALSIYKKNNIHFSMLFASLAAAQNIEFMANSKSINKLSLIKSLQSYLK